MAEASKKMVTQLPAIDAGTLPVEREYALKYLDYFWRRSRSSGAGWLIATGSEPGKVSSRASSS
jgi:hypothetical protein